MGLAQDQPKSLCPPSSGFLEKDHCPGSVDLPVAQRKATCPQHPVGPLTVQPLLWTQTGSPGRTTEGGYEKHAPLPAHGDGPRGVPQESGGGQPAPSKGPCTAVDINALRERNDKSHLKQPPNRMEIFESISGVDSGAAHQHQHRHAGVWLHHKSSFWCFTTHSKLGPSETLTQVLMHMHLPPERALKNKRMHNFFQP